MDLFRIFRKEIDRCARLGIGTYLMERLGVLLRNVFDLGFYLISRLLFNRPRFRPFFARYPLCIKKVIYPYLVSSFTKRVRLLVFLNHYRIIWWHFLPGFLNQVLDGGIVLWVRSINGARFCISLSYETLGTEGELSLVLTRDGENVFSLSFTLVPGKHLEVDAAQVLLISRVQGARDYEIVRASIKAFGGYRPQEMLIAGARSVAQELGITCLAGIVAQQQICWQKASIEHAFFNYDRFWGEIGGCQFSDRIFLLPLKPRHTPLQEISRAHRARKSAQYQLEREVIEGVGVAFKERCLHHPLSPHGPEEAVLPSPSI